MSLRIDLAIGFLPTRLCEHLAIILSLWSLLDILYCVFTYLCLYFYFVLFIYCICAFGHLSVLIFLSFSWLFYSYTVFVHLSIYLYLFFPLFLGHILHLLYCVYCVFLFLWIIRLKISIMYLLIFFINILNYNIYFIW